MEAPPPVETCVRRPSRPKRAHGRHGVAAAGHRDGDAAGDGLADGARAGRELRRSRTGPSARSRRSCRRPRSWRTNSAVGLRADVERHLVGGDAVGGDDASSGAPPSASRGHDDVGRAARGRTRDVAGLARGSRAATATSSLGALGRADLVALGGQERVGHGAADEHGVGEVEHVPDEADLVRDLEAAQDHDERPRRVAQQAAEDLELLRHEQAGHGGQVVRDALGGGVRAVRRAEGVVHVDVAERRQLLGEAGVVAVSSAWKRRFSSSSTSPGVSAWPPPARPRGRRSRRPSRPGGRAARRGAPPRAPCAARRRPAPWAGRGGT